MQPCVHSQSLKFAFPALEPGGLKAIPPVRRKYTLPLAAVDDDRSEGLQSALRDAGKLS